MSSARSQFFVKKLGTTFFKILFDPEDDQLSRPYVYQLFFNLQGPHLQSASSPCLAVRKGARVTKLQALAWQSARVLGLPSFKPAFVCSLEIGEVA